ncbi:MAG: hypothetical protein HKN10_20115 [Myxococcales bacterium]|nr:hypothetical protein [Deltaproteobacteria bacterium]NNE20781.1 hypothetical protein [Myxococcales bacterium]
MKELMDKMVPLLALVSLIFVGCSSSNEDPNGMGGAGGVGGLGGGGSAGAAGVGGTEPPATGIYTGTGDAPDGTFTICFVVNEEGTALVRPTVSSPGSTCSTDPTEAFAVEFDTDLCEGGLLTTEEIPIVDGMFELVNEEGGLAGYWVIRGTIDGSSAFGEAEVGVVAGGTCMGNWQATLSE